MQPVSNCVLPGLCFRLWTFLLAGLCLVPQLLQNWRYGGNMIDHWQTPPTKQNLLELAYTWIGFAGVLYMHGENIAHYGKIKHSSALSSYTQYIDWKPIHPCLFATSKHNSYIYSWNDSNNLFHTFITMCCITIHQYSVYHSTLATICQYSKI